MGRWAWWLMLAALMLGTSCAAKAAPVTPPHYLLLDERVPNDTLVCAPLTVKVERWQYGCLPIDEVRWYLRNQKKGRT